MRLVILILVAIAVALTSLFLLQIDSGYVLVRAFGYSFETSAAVMIALLVVAMGCFYLLARLLVRSVHLPGDLRDYRNQSRINRSQDDLVRGLVQLNEGKWQEAEKCLTRRADFSPTPLLHYINAARAAQLQRSPERRDHWLAKARLAKPKAELALGVAEAELHVLVGDLPQAIESLDALRNVAPKHGYVLKLLFRAHLRLQNWDALTGLLPRLRRYKLMPEAELDQHSATIYSHYFSQAAQNVAQQAVLQQSGGNAEDDSMSGPEARWDEMPKRLHNDPEIAASYAEFLHAAQRDLEAGKLVNQQLRQGWNERLATLYGWLNLDNETQIRQVQEWQQQYVDEPALLLTAGRLHLRSGNLDQAKIFIEKSAQLLPQQSTWQALGQVMEQLGDGTAAFIAYREAAKGDMVENATPMALPSTVSDEPLDDDVEQVEGAEGAPPKA